MKHIIVPDKEKDRRQLIEKQVSQAKKLHAIYLSNLSLKSIPQNVLDVNNLKILDLGFNNIEELPAASLKTLHSLEQFHLNDNPLQYIPIEIRELKNITVLNLANTQVKYLPREFAELKKIYKLSMSNCPLKHNLKQAYDQGIVPLFVYLQRKYDRAIYRELIVKKLKEWVYMGNTVEQIQQLMQKVMDELKDVETTQLKRLLRNLQNIFNVKLEEVDARQVRTRLFSTLVQASKTKGQQLDETSNQYHPPVIGDTLPIPNNSTINENLEKKQ